MIKGTEHCVVGSILFQKELREFKIAHSLSRGKTLSYVTTKDACPFIFVDKREIVLQQYAEFGLAALPDFVGTGAEISLTETKDVGYISLFGEYPRRANEKALVILESSSTDALKIVKAAKPEGIMIMPGNKTDMRYIALIMLIHDLANLSNL